MSHRCKPDLSQGRCGECLLCSYPRSWWSLGHSYRPIHLVPDFTEESCCALRNWWGRVYRRCADTYSGTRRPPDKAPIQVPCPPIETLGSEQKKALVPVVVGGCARVPPFSFGESSARSATSMAVSQLCPEPSKRAERLSKQTSAVRRVAEFPTQPFHAGPVTQATGLLP